MIFPKLHLTLKVILPKTLFDRKPHWTEKVSFSTENLMMYLMQNQIQTGLVVIISRTRRLGASKTMMYFMQNKPQVGFSEAAKRLDLEILLTHGAWRRRRNYYNQTSLSLFMTYIIRFSVEKVSVK
jgi:hypothetical protein